MKQLDILVLIFLALWLIGWVVVFLLVRNYCKHHRFRATEEDPHIDMPDQYEEYELSERPYIEML